MPHYNKQKAALILPLLLLGCAHAPAPAPGRAHLQQSDAVTAESNPAIPQPVQASAALPRPKAAAKVETYSVVVQNIPAQDLLFALARDAKLNVDVHPGILGTVTLNAIDQTLQQLLTRISKQVDMRWELDGPNLIVMPDSPYLRTYTVDYVNMARDTTVNTSVNSQVNSGSQTSGSGTGTSSGSNNNSSTTKIDNTSKNHFWDRLESNLQDILQETDKILPEGSSDTVIEKNDEQSGGVTSIGAKSVSVTTDASGKTKQSGTTTIRRTTFREAASVIVNPESGVVTVRATARQHEKIVDFLDSVTKSARRQVMIEATIVQVNLSDGYQQGIDWSRIRADGSGFAVSTPILTNSLNPLPTAVLTTPSSSLNSNLTNITNATLSRVDNSNPLNLAQAVTLLNTFGTVKVLSSPKLSVLNNQTAVLKVVNNIVYFTIVSNVAAGNTGAAQTATTATPQTVSVGLVMSVTPQIGSDKSIILNVRPSISKVSSFVQDPTNINNRIPQIQTSEIESIMRLNDSDIAVLGGLMQESGDYQTGRIPGIGDVPLLGELFTSRNNAKTKSELVIFLRPVVVQNPSLTGDYRNLKDYLPDTDFNRKPGHAEFLPSRDTHGTASNGENRH